MKKITLFISIVSIIFLNTLLLQANVKNELRQLTNTLNILEAQLNETPPPVPPREDIPDFTPPPLPPREECPVAQQGAASNNDWRNLLSKIKSSRKRPPYAQLRPTSSYIPSQQPTIQQQTTPELPPVVPPREPSRIIKQRPQSTPPQPAQRIVVETIETPAGISLQMRRFINQANEILRSKSKENAQRLLNVINSLQEETLKPIEQKVKDRIKQAMQALTK